MVQPNPEIDPPANLTSMSTFQTFCKMFAALIGAAAMGTATALSVTQPMADAVITAGNDFATEVLGDAWDMSNGADIDADQSYGVANQIYANGLYSFTTTIGSDNEVFPLFMGYPSSINLTRGFNHPIDTSKYRYLTIKIRESKADVMYVIFLQSDSGSYNGHACGQTTFKALPAGQWLVFTYDLSTSYMTSTTCANHWLDFPTVAGIRLNPALDNSTPFQPTNVDIDWIRLTGDITDSEKTTVAWNDTGYSGNYNITLNETGSSGTSILLATNVPGTSYAADLTRFPAGSYTIAVSRSSDPTTQNTSGSFRINSPPQIVITAPSERGDQTKNFAATVVGNPWGPITATDFSQIVDFTNVSYNAPVNSFYGRPKSQDSQWYMNLGGHVIDTSVYRSFCFTMKDFGPLSIGTGSVARFFWGPPSGGLTVSQDIPLQSGLNQYCIADVAAVPVEDVSTGGPWLGTESVLRLDPHEFPVSAACMQTATPSNCHDVELDSVVLSPFSQANPGFTFAWSLTDSDDSLVNLRLFLDPDQDRDNGNGILIFDSNVTNTTTQFPWPGSGSVNYGQYYVLAIADDGRNSVAQYSTGPIIIGARDGLFRNGFDVN